MGWKIETFNKNLKCGWTAEESQLRTASRLTNRIAIFCILAWRVFWLTEINRSAPEASPEVALTATEGTLLDQLVKDTARTAEALPLSRNLIKLAQLGGYLARADDPHRAIRSSGAACIGLSTLNSDTDWGGKDVGNLKHYLPFTSAIRYGTRGNWRAIFTGRGDKTTIKLRSGARRVPPDI